MATEEAIGIFQHTERSNDSVIDDDENVPVDEYTVLLNKDKERTEMKILEAPIKIIVIIGFYLVTLKIFDLKSYIPKKSPRRKTHILGNIIRVLIIILQIMFVLAFIAEVIYVKTARMVNRLVDTDHYVRIQKELLVIRNYTKCFEANDKLVPFTTLQLYLLFITYSIAVLFSFLFLIVYSWKATDNFTPIGIINTTRNNRSIVRTMIESQLAGQSLAYLKFDAYRNKIYINVFWFIVQTLFIFLTIAAMALWFYRNLVCGAEILIYWQSYTQREIDQIAHIFLQLFNIVQWHISPVAVCLLIRLVCIRLKAEIRKTLTETLAKLMYRVRGNNNISIWIDFYKLQNTISIYANKFTLITILLVLISITGTLQIVSISLTSSSEQLQALWEHNWFDVTEIYLLYYTYLVSIWIMVDGMASLNEKLKSYSDQLLTFLAINNTKITITEQITKDISLIPSSYRGFQMSIFGPPFANFIKLFYPIAILIITGLFLSGNLQYGGYTYFRE